MRQEAGDLDSGKFFVPIQLDNQEFEFFCDSGATFSGLKQNSITNSYPIIGTHNFHSAAGVVLTAGNIVVGNIKLDKLVRTEFKLTVLPQQFSHENTLGLDLLKKQRFVFDARGLRLTVPSSSRTMLDTRLSLTKKGLISIPLFVGNTMSQGIWDTGAELTVVSESFVKANKSSFDFVKEVDKGNDSTGASVKFMLYRLRHLRVGPIILDSLNVLSMDFSAVRAHFGAGADFILGFNCIRGKIWEFDLAAMSWTAT